MNLRVEVVDRLADLDPWAAAWDRLAERHPPCRPTLGHAWVRAHLAHRLGPRETWRVALALRDDDLVGVLPVVVRPRTVFAQVLATVADDHTPSGDLVAAPEDAPTVGPALLAAHFESAPRAVALTLRGAVATSPLLALASGARETHRGAWMDTDRPIEACLDALGRGSRSKLRRAEAALEATAPLVARFDRARPEDGEAAFARFLALERAGWKGRAGTAIDADPARRAFYRELTDRLAAAGRLQWHVLEHGGRPIAAEMAVRWGATLVIHKVAYDEAVAAHSPGNLLWARTLAWACAHADVAVVDVLAEDELMRRWRATPYGYFAAHIDRPGLRAALFARTPAALRAAARRVAGRPR